MFIFLNAQKHNKAAKKTGALSIFPPRYKNRTKSDFNRGIFSERTISKIFQTAKKTIIVIEIIKFKPV